MTGVLEIAADPSPEPKLIWRAREDGLEQAVVFEPGYNKRGSQYGVHGMGIRFLLRGPKGCTQFVMNTGWVPGESMRASSADMFPMAYDLGYHAHVPQYGYGEEWVQRSTPDCPYLDGAECFYDGSGLNAEPVMAAFIVEGESAVWSALQIQYDNIKGEESK